MTTHHSVRPKSSPTIKTLWSNNKQQILFAVCYVSVFALVTFIFYRRFPNNYQQPNFYAEDGYVFGKNLIQHGFLHSVTTTFNGYYLWGLYLLYQASEVVNRLFFHNEFANLARSFSVVSYVFLGFITTLPMLLFKKYFRPIALALIITLAAFVPLPGSDYAILGTIGNLKFAFIYLAFLLLVYRNLMPENSKKVYLVDAGLLICAYTNITIYPMLLFALVRYIPKLKGKYFYKHLLRDRSFQSLLILGFALLPQLYIVKRDGVPELKGYLDTPYNFKRTIEIFVSRSYLYGLLAPINKHLNDAVVMIVAVIALVAGIKFSGKYRKIFIFGILTIFVTTFLFVIKRTGISDSYMGYKSGGPDQFFYPQNWVFTFVVSLVVVELASKLPRIRYRVLTYMALFTVILLFLAPIASTYGKNNFMADDVGTIYAIGKQACDSSQQQFDIPIYPSPHLLVYPQVSRAMLCTASVTSYYPHTVTFGLTPAGNNYLDGLGSKNNFTQTFTSPQDKLSGISVYFSTFMAKVKSPYNLVLMDSSCKNTLQTVSISAKKLHDNTYTVISFKPIQNSKNVTYCFSIVSGHTNNVSPLAVQLSAPNIYIGGSAMVNGSATSKDIVFNLYYR